MPSKIWLILLALSLSSCQEAPKPPDVRVCTPVLRPNSSPDLIASYYAFCVSRKEPNDVAQHVRIELSKALQERFVLMSPTDYASIGIFEQDLTDWGKAHCSKKTTSE